MPVLFDASYLMRLLDPTVTGQGDADARVDHLVRSLDATRTRIIVPTPALSEVLIGAGRAAAAYLDIIARSSRFRIAPFGTRAAVEAAAAHRDAIRAGDKREGSDAQWGKVKFDRQIVAIAKVEGAAILYSNDKDIVRFTARDAVQVVTFEQLPVPSETLQGELSFMPDRDDDANSPPG